MKRRAVRILAGFSPEDLFSVAADVEAYPEFLPFCQAARIRARDGSRLSVDNRFGFGPLSVVFRSQTLLDGPSRIDIRSRDGPFRDLRITWRFEPLRPEGCKVTFTLDQTLRPGPFRLVAELFASAVEKDVIDAFEKRARKLAAGDQGRSPRRNTK